MPIISIPQTVLFSKLQREYSDKEFEELCFLFGLELDEITSEKELVAKEMGKDKSKGCKTDLIYKIELPANRYDLICCEGLTRALMIFNGKMDIPVYITTNVSKPIQLFVKPSTQNVRPFVVAAVLRNIKLDDASYNSFIELQEKLHKNLCRKRTLVAIGTHDLDTIQPPFYYEAKPPKEICFVPLNLQTCYSAVELMELYSTNSHLKPYLSIIEDKPEYPVITDSSGTVLSMPPIINGNHSRVSTQTRNIFIEATGTDLQKAIITLDTIVTMFSEYCDEAFSVEPVEVIQHDGNRQTYPRLAYRDEVISVDYVNRLLGTQISEQEVIDLLMRMGLQATAIHNSSPISEKNSLSSSPKPETFGLVSVRIPPTRHDILHACDIVEDVAIAYGYDRIPEHLPQTYCVASTQPINKLSDLIRAEIAQLGFTEALSFTLCSRDDISTNFGYDLNEIPAVHVANPKTLDFQVVRTTLLPGILHTIANNRSLPLPLKLFEVQDVVHKDQTKDVGARNCRRICAVYYNKHSGFEIIHGLLDRLMQVLQVHSACSSMTSGKIQSEGDCPTDILKYRLKSVSDPAYFPQRCANIVLEPNDQVIGQIGVLHPNVLRNFDLTMPCSAIDLDLEIFL